MADLLLRDGIPPPMTGTFIPISCPCVTCNGEGTDYLLIQRVHIYQDQKGDYTASISGWLFRAEQDGCRWTKNVSWVNDPIDDYQEHAPHEYWSRA